MNCILDSNNKYCHIFNYLINSIFYNVYYIIRIIIYILNYIFILSETIDILNKK